MSEVIARNLRNANDNRPEAYPEMNWPAIDNSPLDELANNEGLICKAFPCLFPYGRGDLNCPRLNKIPANKYFKYLLQYHDGRFSKDERFPYYAFNSLARYSAISAGNVYVHRHEMGTQSRDDLIEIADNPNSNLADSIMYYGVSLRSTRSYWKQRCSELTAMIRQLGNPTFFFTLSAADYHWPDLFRILSPHRATDSLTDRERSVLMHDNPAIVSWFFRKRVDIFFSKFLKPLFGVKEHWFRYEWQHRGSPHVHGLLWLNDSVDCTDIDALSEAERQNIVDYFDRYVTATITHQNMSNEFHLNPCKKRFMDLNEEEKLRDLDMLLFSVKRHTRCGSHCLRKRRDSRRIECRFGFPIPCEANSKLILENGAHKFIPKRNDTFLQRYNKYITQAWRGNSDFSPITSEDAVIKYISKYASKGEFASEPYSEILRQILNRNDGNSTARSLIQKLLITSVAERNFSAQEVMHLTLGWPLFHASRSFTVLSLNNHWRHINSSVSGIVERYSIREEEFDDLTLFNYARSYRWDYRRKRNVRREHGDTIVRIFPNLSISEDDDENEEYFKLQCKLHVPWRGNFDNLISDDMTCCEFYANQMVDQEREEHFGQELPLVQDVEYDDPPPPEPSDIVRNPGYAASRMHPNQQVQDPIGFRIIDEAESWSTLDRYHLDIDQVRDFLQSFRTQPINEDITEQPCIPFTTMSAEQQEVMNKLRFQVVNLDSCVDKITLIQGKAGTGKSASIKAMISALEDFQTRTQMPRLFEVCAPTGAAAINIDGKTIHNLLRIPVQGPLLPLAGSTLRNFQLEFEKTHFIIIDEYSMVGSRLWQKIHERLCQAKSNLEPFGGLFVYIFGDLRQLPPVKDTAIYMEPNDDYSRLGQSLFNNISSTVILNISHRQGPDQQMFRDLLDSIASGQANENHWRLLMTRRSNLLDTSSFDDAIRLFPTNNQVKEYNLDYLRRLRQPVAIIDAKHNNATARIGDDSLAQGLPKQLYLAKNCRIMLRANICVTLGLVNGSLGTVVDIIYNNEERPPVIPFCLLIKFDNYRGPTLPGQYFPLKPIEVKWKQNNVDCRRYQFPVSIAYALTIHKAQGLTLNKAVIDIGDKEISTGLTYVALSRVKTIDGLMLSRGFDFSRLSRIRSSRCFLERERFITRLTSQQDLIQI